MSAIGFFVGLLFIGLGVFVAIPNIGIFGVVWTLVAVFITIYHGVNAFSARGVAQEVVEFESPDSSPDAPPFPKSTEQRLADLEGLKQKGLITPEEYEQQRKRILDEL